MDLNQSLEFDVSIPSPPVQNFMPMPSFMFPYHQTVKENSERAGFFRFVQLQKQNLEVFWNQQMLEINNTTAFKNNHQLPLARIKRVMKSDGSVKMISADTPILFSKAIELFILELTLRAWLQTEDCKRRILQRCDIVRAIRHDRSFDFLVDAIPYDLKDEEDGEHSDVECVPEVPLPFPMMDINKDWLMKDYGSPPQFMIKPLMLSAQCSYEPAPK